MPLNEVWPRLSVIEVASHDSLCSAKNAAKRPEERGHIQGAVRARIPGGVLLDRPLHDEGQGPRNDLLVDRIGDADSGLCRYEAEIAHIKEVVVHDVPERAGRPSRWAR